MSAIRLIVGLGNPGTQYEGTRHNAGAFFVRRLAAQCGLTLAADRNALGESARGTVTGHDLRLLIPETFMNESGKSVQLLANFYQIKPEEIMIIHDELDIQPGITKLKFGGGHGGHNGLKSIQASIGSNNFWRLRIGIGHPGSKEKVNGFVLSKPSNNESKLIEESILKSYEIFSYLMLGQFDKAMINLHSAI